MQIVATSPADYITKLPEGRRADIRALIYMIEHEAPQLKPSMQYGMIGYGAYKYKYASGREGSWVQIALAAQKNYTSLYVACTKDGSYLAESYKEKLPKANIGKSCIRFKKLEDLDHKVLRELISEAASLYKKEVVS